MIHFMIDFENTRSKGLQGAEYLQPDDFVTIFYSQFCMKIERRRFRQLKESGCSFRLCKLQKTGKNALDFYIASHIGEIFIIRSSNLYRWEELPAISNITNNKFLLYSRRMIFQIQGRFSTA